MAKYKKGNYYQAYKVIDDPRLKGLPYQCIYIYQILQELEHKYTCEEKQYFFRSDSDFANDCRMPISTFKKYKAILLERNEKLRKNKIPLFLMWQNVLTNSKTGNHSYKHISHYIFPD